MISSRDITTLHPKVKGLCEKFINKCKYDILITSTYRDNEAQASLYAQGRTAPGRIITKAKPGYSFHNYRVAFDIVPVINGKPVWGTNGKYLEIWMDVGKIGKECGLEWAGDWVVFKEFPHFQYTRGISIRQFLAGKTLD